MKSQHAIALIIGLFLCPLVVRLTSPNLYLNGLGNDPYVGPLLAILIDITCMWFMLVMILVSTRLVRWLRSRA